MGLHCCCVGLWISNWQVRLQSYAAYDLIDCGLRSFDDWKEEDWMIEKTKSLMHALFVSIMPLFVVWMWYGLGKYRMNGLRYISTRNTSLVLGDFFCPCNVNGPSVPIIGYQTQRCLTQCCLHMIMFIVYRSTIFLIQWAMNETPKMAIQVRSK